MHGKTPRTPFGGSLMQATQRVELLLYTSNDEFLGIHKNSEIFWRFPIFLTGKSVFETQFHGVWLGRMRWAHMGLRSLQPLFTGGPNPGFWTRNPPPSNCWSEAPQGGGMVGGGGWEGESASKDMQSRPARAVVVTMALSARDNVHVACIHTPARQTRMHFMRQATQNQTQGQ